MTTEETLRQRITELEAECKQLRDVVTAQREGNRKILESVAAMLPWHVKDHLECVFCRECAPVDWDAQDRRSALAAATAAIEHAHGCAHIQARKLLGME